MQRVTRSDSPYTALQQRLKYADRFLTKPATVIVDNVPLWPNNLLEVIAPDAATVACYGDCSGSADLIKGISTREELTYGQHLAVEKILITNGALHGLSLIFRSIHQLGAVALCQTPVLASIPALLRECGYRVSFFSTLKGEIDIEAILAQGSPDVRLIYINTPNNPTGEICSEDAIRKLVQLTEKRQVSLVVDQVYDSFVFGDRKLFSPMSFNDNWQYLYTVNSMSKNFGTPGLRIGWIVSDAKNIEQLAGRIERECIAVCGWAQQQASHLLSIGNRPLVQRVLEGRRFVQEYLSSFPGIEFVSPAGGTQFFLKFPVDDVDAFADYMLLEYGLILTTASNYVGVEESFIRIPIGYPLATIKHALELLREGLTAYSSYKKL
jgi:beta-methylarginine biosynthesis bifunctional aminotransferase